MAAQNVLLKSLEELPDSVEFWLSADQQNRLLETVVSRCRVISLDVQTKSLSPDEEKEMVSLFTLVSQKKVGQLLKLAEVWSKNNPEAKLEALNSFLLERSRKLPSPARAAAIKSVLECLGDCRGQVNSQLALEHLFLELIELTTSA